MTMIPLEHLVAHPKNSNVLSDVMMKRLEANIKASGHYPPIIVRKLEEHRYQILDGHHRMLACTQLGMKEFKCDVWDNISDVQADILIATLNTVKGEQDPEKRTLLLRSLCSQVTVPDLRMLLPESGKQLAKLLDLNTATALPEENAATDNDSMVKFSVRMFKSQERVLKEALEMMRSRVLDDGAPSCNDATALEYMAAEVLAMPVELKQS